MKGAIEIIGIGGPFVIVAYPWRKTRDLYVMNKGHPIKCCQPNCGALILETSEAFNRHVAAHIPRRYHGGVGVMTDKKAKQNTTEGLE